MERKELIRMIYLYLFSLVGLVLVIIGLVQIVDLGLKAYVFTKADEVYIYPEYPRLTKGPSEETATLSPEEEQKYKEQQLEFQKKEREANRHRTAANSLAMIIIGAPLFFYHWSLVKKDRNNNNAHLR